MAVEGAMRGREACMVGGVCEGETATEAGGTHPTRMHSCVHFCFIIVGFDWRNN